jgi:hypothetical protein
MKGWVYILSNKAMPNLVKVGHTTRDTQSRIQEIDGTGVPHPYDIEYEVQVDNSYHVEQKTHAILGHYRENKKREFFRCSIAVAISAIREAANGGIILENNRHEKNAHVEAELRKIEQEKARLDYERIEREKQEKEVNRQRIDKETRETLSENFIGLWGISIVIGCLLLGSFSAGSFLLAAIVLVFNYLSSKSSKDSAIELRKSFSLVDLKLQEELTRKEQELAEKQRKSEQSLSGWVLGFVGLAVVLTVASLGNKSNTVSNSTPTNPPANMTSVKPVATVKSLEPVTIQNESKPIAENTIGCVVGNCTNGKGTYTFENGDKYIGKFKNRQINGKGTYFYANGDKYEGKWRDATHHGQGTYTLANGTVRKGNWKNGQLVSYLPRQSSINTKQATKALVRKQTEPQAREREQTETFNPPIQTQILVQPEINTKPLSLRDKAEADSRAFSQYQQENDKRQAAENRTWVERQWQ